MIAIKNINLKSPTNLLIATNVAIAVVVLILGWFGIRPIWLEVSSDITTLLHTPWTLLTYALVHERFFHLLFNMLVLWWLGHIIERKFTAANIVGLYLLGALFGALTFTLAFSTMPYFAQQFPGTMLTGASAAVLAFATAIPIAMPEHKLHLPFIGNISMKWIAIVLILVSFFGVTGPNAGGDVAHLGGALLGVCYALIYNYIKKHKPYNIFAENGQRESKYHFQRGTRTTDTHYCNRKDADIDAILEKIKCEGYARLTDDEKEKLFKK